MEKNKIPARNKMIIRDAVDIETDIQDTVPVGKTSLTDSEQVTYSAVDLRHQHLKIFSLLTTSDKEINQRLYPDEHVQDMCKNHSWTTPYAKPLQTNHDIELDCNARFFDSWYLNHDDLKPQFGYGQLPQGVIDEFNKRGAFKEGTGSTIGMAETANADFKKKIIDGTYLTTSQGASTNSLTCNICGKSYRDWTCGHLRGSTYPIMSEDGKTIKEMRKCVPYTGALDAVEDSVVNYPANDTSTLLVFDTKKNRVVNMDNITEYSDIFPVVNDNKKAPTVQDTTTTKNNVVTDNKEIGLTPEQIEAIKKLMDQGKTVPSSILTEGQTQQTDTNTDTQNKGGKMPYVIKNATAKRIFKDDLKNLGVTDMEKVSALFDGYDDTQLEFAMDLLGFISDNRKVEPTTPVATKEPTTTPVTDDKNNPQPTVPVNEPTKPQAQDTVVTETTEYKAIKDQLDKALKMLCDLKGIENEVPNLAELEAKIKDKETSSNKIDNFDF